ncbi:EAL domain-containing protein [Paraglaciecola aestuariivivens]
MNLRQKLFGPLLLIVTIPVIVLGGFAYNLISDLTKTSLINSINDVSQSLAPAVNEKINTAETNLRLFGSSRLLQDYIIRGEERYTLLQPSLIRQFSEYQNVYPDYFSISLILENGEVDSSVDNRENPNLTFDLSDWGFYQLLTKTTDNEVILFVEEESDTGKYILSLGLPLSFSPQFSATVGGQVVKRNYLTLSLYLDYIDNIIQNVSLSEGSLLIVTAPNNKILFSSDPNADSKTDEYLSLVEDSEGFYLLNSTNESYYVSSVSLAHGFKLYAMVPTTKFNESANELAWKLLLFFLGIVLSIFVISLLYIQRLLLRPIYAIKNLVSDITLGRMNSSLPFSKREDELGELSGSIIKMRDKIKENNEKIEKLAYFDELTGLPNRFSMHLELERYISRANRSSTKFALAFLDLDNFKDVNDTLGHDVGDQLLIEASNRILQNLRIDDHVLQNKHATLETDAVLARLGGDEFTVLIAGIAEPSLLQVPLDRVIQSLSSPFVIADERMTVGVSIGIAVYPDDGQESKELLKCADLAMYEAKRNGKNCFAFYSQEMNKQAFERQSLETALRNAQQNNEFSLHFQPRMRMSDYAVEGFEALLRWHTADLGPVSPYRFIPIVEANLQIVQIGRWLLEQACQKVKHWLEMGYNDFRLSVNVSPVQLHRDNLVLVISKALSDYGISGKYLEIEITESVLLEDEKQAITTLNDIKKLGVRIALDDFGTGYSSLSILRNLPIDILKIDQSFVIDIADNPDSANVFEAIVQLAKKLNLTTVAEGVETASHHEMVLLAKCDHAQGYYYAKPLTESQADSYVQSSLLRNKVIEQDNYLYNQGNKLLD